MECRSGPRWAREKSLDWQHVPPCGAFRRALRLGSPADNPNTAKNEKETEVSNAAAHEVGHQLGLGENQNQTKGAQDVMSTNVAQGSLAQPLTYNATDAAKLKAATK